MPPAVLSEKELVGNTDSAHLKPNYFWLHLRILSFHPKPTSLPVFTISMKDKSTLSDIQTKYLGIILNLLSLIFHILYKNKPCQALPPKYIQNPITFYHSHCYYSSSSHQYLLPGLLLIIIASTRFLCLELLLLCLPQPHCGTFSQKPE